MKTRIRFVIFLAGLVGHGALAGVVTKDPGFTSSVMLADFNGVTDRSYGLTRLAHDSTGAGLGNYSYAAGQGGGEAYAWFYSDPVPPAVPSWDPNVHQNIRVRMSSIRDAGESRVIQVFAWGPAVVGATTATASVGTTLGEFSFALDPAGLPGLDGRTIRVDPFNYENISGTDYWTVDYIMADVGVSRGAEMDSDADTNRFVTTGIDSITISNSIYSGTATSTDPNLHIFSGVYVDADFYNYVEIRMKAAAASIVDYFWRTDASVGYRSDHLETSGDGEWHTYLIDMSGEPDWTGILTANRLDPTHLSGTDFEVDYVRFLSVLPPFPDLDYEGWAGGWGGVDIGSETNDYDNDGLSNLYEFGLNGDPTNSADQGTLPVYSIVDDGGSNVVRCVHPQRSDPGSGLVYSLAVTTNLVSGDWAAAGYGITGTNSPDGPLDFVTNTVDMAARQKFIRLNIGNPSFTLWQLPSQSGTQMMSYVIESEDGKVVVIDGGWEEDASYLRSFIAARGYHVDAWFITHPHADHIEALTWILLNPGGTVIDHIYASFPPLEWYQEHAPGTAETLSAFTNALASVGKNYIDVDPGDIFNIDEIHIEILATENPEILASAVNNSSMVMMVSDPQKSILFLGDTESEAGDKILGAVDHEKLKADYVQASHHGNWGVDFSFYDIVLPDYCLWPTPLWLWNNDNGGGYDSGPWTTLETRQWMDILYVKSNYVSGVSGLIEIK